VERASLEYYMGYVDYMAQQTIGDLRAYARRYIVGKPHITEFSSRRTLASR